MLDRLAPEILHLILDYLLRFRYEKTTDSDSPLTGFVNLCSWNEISNYLDLMALAHTCKQLKLVVYSVIFKSWACISADYGFYMHGAKKVVNKKGPPFFYSRVRWTFFFLPRVSYSDYNGVYNLQPEQLRSLLSPTYKPRFYIAGSDMLPDALQYIQHLSLSFNDYSVPYSELVPQYFPKMSALKEVTFNMDGPVIGSTNGSVDFAKDLVLVMESVKNHGNFPMVHMYLKLSFEKEKELVDYLLNFQKSWRQWDTLAIEKLVIDINWFEYSISEEFLQSISRLTHLKSLILDFMDDGGFCDSTIREGYPLSQTLMNLPNLEELHVRLRCPRCREDSEERALLRQALLPKQEHKQKVPFKICRLSWTICDTNFFAPFENFDSLTYFEVFEIPCSCIIPVKLPPLQNLETLVLTNCTWKHLETIIRQCKAHSPYLENLIVRNPTGKVPEKKLQMLLSWVKHMEVYQESNINKFTFKDALRNAPNLRHLIYYDITRNTPGKELPWPWFEKQISKFGANLQTIQFLPRFYYCGPRTIKNWLEYQKVTTFGEEAHGFRGIIDEFVLGTKNDTFIVDVQKLLKKLKQ